MNLTKSTNPNSIVLGSAKIEVSRTNPLIKTTDGKKTYELTDLIDMGLARGVSLTFTATKIEVKADNGTVPIKGSTDPKATVTFSLLERHLPLLAQAMAGLVHLETVLALEKTVSDKHSAALETGKLYPLSSFNADASEPRELSLSQTGGTLTAGDDYEIIEAAKTFYFRLIADGSYDSAKILTVTYKVTPAESYILSKGSSGVAKSLSMRLTNKRKTDDGRTINRVFELPYGFYSADDAVTFKSKNDADNVMEVPLSFEFTPHPDMAEDTELEKQSLSREIQQV